jgi:alpha-1,3-rhamnosyltransferase
MKILGIVKGNGDCMLIDRTPLVSVVIPVLNAAKFVRAAILSVLEQSFRDLELIVINDGSNDGTEEVIERTLKEHDDDRATFISRENKGVCRTLNEGLSLSKGKYFAYLGADDIWQVRKLEIQMAELERTNFEAVYSDCWVIDSQGNIVSRYGDQYPYRGGSIYEDIVWSRFQPASPTVLFKRDAIESVGRFNETHIAEDRDLWLRIAKSYKVAYVDEALAYYRVHDSNTSLDLEKSYKYALQVLESTIANDPGLETSRGLLKANVDAFHSAAHFQKLQMSEARRFALAALRINPTNPIALRTLTLSFLGKSTTAWFRERRRRKIAHDSSRRFESEQMLR